MTSLLALLRQNRNYRYTWLGQVVSEIGDYFNNIAVFALVMEKSGSGMVVCGRHAVARDSGGAGGAGRRRAAGPLRPQPHHDRQRPGARGRRAGFVLTIHQPRPWLLYLLSALLMFASPFFTSGRAAILPTIATADELHTANSLTQTTQWATLTAGTLLAGYSAAAFGYRWAFVINSLSFLFSAWAISRIDVPGGFRAHRAAGAAAVRPWHEYREGLAYMRIRPVDDGHRDDLGGLGHGRRRGADSVRALRRAGVPSRPLRHRHHLGLRGHRPAARRRHRALHRAARRLRGYKRTITISYIVARRHLHAVQPGGGVGRCRWSA